MHRTVEAIIEGDGTVRLSEAVSLRAPCRALVTILDEQSITDLTLASQEALAKDWLHPDEEAGGHTCNWASSPHPVSVFEPVGCEASASRS